MIELPEPFMAMSAFNQFIVHRIQPSRDRPGKTDKLPVDAATGRIVSAHDPKFWMPASEACLHANRFGANHGVSFVLTASDPFWFLDIDDCLSEDNVWSDLAQVLCAKLSGAAVEVSHSGRGLHLFGTGRVPAHCCKNDILGIELYHERRAAALTGTGARGCTAFDASRILPEIIDEYFPPSARLLSDQEWTTSPDSDWRGPSDDDELIRRAMNSRSANSLFSSRASFAELWTADPAALARAFPAATREYDASSADAALAQHLAFWTGNDCERIERLMRRSLLDRDKWERGDYLPRTIMSAVSMQFDVLIDKILEPKVNQTAAAGRDVLKPTLVTGASFANTEAQIQLFSGCVYVQDQHKALVPGGWLLRPDQFRVAFGGYVFTMDAANEKVSKDAWEAFTQNQAYRAPRADSTCFRPTIAPGSIVTRDGMKLVNSYWPVEISRKRGDVTPFMCHLKKLLPDEHDQLILLSYMAACVQHKGVKFQWAPLIQGVEGNGKTALTRCVAEAIGRRYVHWPKASKLGAQFNSWMVNNLFYAVEDIYVPDKKREIIEELKPMITGGDGLEIEAKGVDQISIDICGNFMFNSNHRDAIRKTKKDRRFCILFTAQQDVEDLLRDGMDEKYCSGLYEWLNDEGYSIVSEFLHTFEIPEKYNPAVGCHRAPVSSSTAAAIESSAGGIEQDVLEAIGQGAPGFCGGWISSIQLDGLLEKAGSGRRVTHAQRRELLKDLGYLPHPALIDGRVNNVVLPDGAKPRLFIHNDSPDRAIVGAAATARAYEAANNHVSNWSNRY